MADAPHVTVLFDNYPGLPGLTSLWGFAALIRVEERSILFDTGSNGRVLLRNMAALGLSPESVDLIFLSHPHWDHIGGLDSVLELNPGVTVAVHRGFSKHLVQDLRSLCGDLVVVGPDPYRLAPGVFSTGMLDGEPPEHSLAIDRGGVTAVVAGCAHCGMEAILERAGSILGKKVAWALGGFHSMDADSETVRRSVSAIEALGVTRVVPTHCTGDLAIAAFRDAFGERCIDGGVGRAIALR